MNMDTMQERQDRDLATSGDGRQGNNPYFDWPDEDNPNCPACNGDGVALGELGSNIWYRCRDCGIDFCSGGANE
jgi:hypothetical protein